MQIIQFYVQPWYNNHQEYLVLNTIMLTRDRVQLEHDLDILVLEQHQTMIDHAMRLCKEKLLKY
jgi:hypothetical protein